MADHRHDPKHNAKPPVDDSLSGKALDVVQDTREMAQHAFEQSRDSARQAAQRTAAGIEANPIGVVVGGVALGALVAGLIPRGRRERDLLAPVGRRLSATATAAIAAAKESGKAELEARGLTREGARDQARSLFEAVSKVATGAGTAAVSAAREKVATPSSSPSSAS